MDNRKKGQETLRGITWDKILLFQDLKVAKSKSQGSGLLVQLESVIKQKYKIYKTV